MLPKCLAVAVLLALVTTICAVEQRGGLDCYGDLGCFPQDFPWSSIPRPMPPPQAPDRINTQFYLHTRNTTEEFLVVKLPRVSLDGATFDGRKATFFLTHGFLAHADVAWLDEMKDALLKRFDANVFIVKWVKGATNLNYFEVAANTRIVGAEIARLITHLIKDHGANTSRMHLVGHSLGAHIMSYAAKRVPNIARLTALDPAQPGFEGYPPQVRLDKSDAQFVEVIHTNARPFIPLLGAGMMGETGHVDFYINGGWDQPGCLIPKNIPVVRSVSEFATLPVEVFANIVKCPHERAIHIFTASILNPNCVFWGSGVSPFSVAASILSGGNLPWLMFKTTCSKDRCSPLGLEAINYPARGSFLLATTWNEPFCIEEPDTDKKMAPYRSVKDISEYEVSTVDENGIDDVFF